MHRCSLKEEDDPRNCEKVPMKGDTEVPMPCYAKNESAASISLEDFPGPRPSETSCSENVVGTTMSRRSHDFEAQSVPGDGESDKKEIRIGHSREKVSSLEDQKRLRGDKSVPDRRLDLKINESGRQGGCIGDQAQDSCRHNKPLYGESGCPNTAEMSRGDSCDNTIDDLAVEVPPKEARCGETCTGTVETEKLEQIREILKIAMRFSSHLADKTEFSDIERLDVDGMVCKAYCCDVLAEKMKSVRFSDNFIYNKKIRGKSGSLIFFTEDFKYAIKVIRPKELDVSIKNMPLMSKYLNENRHSLIAKSAGLYSSPGMNFIVMENIFDSGFDQIFDLKGAGVQRKAMGISTEGDWKGNTLLLKDRKTTVEIISQDTSFLRSLNLMDYSLVIGRNKDHFRTFRAYDRQGNEIDSKIEDSKGYSLGIADVLTEYDLVKRLERIFHFLCCMDGGSTAHPEEYRDRFMDLIHNECFEDEEPSTGRENK